VRKRRAVHGGYTPWPPLSIAFFATICYLDRAEFFCKNPLENAQFAPLTNYQGAELEAAISADGKFVVFKSDHEGKFDA